MKKIILITGKACAGKDTLVKELIKDLDLSMSVSFTTRPPRTREQNGVEYNFISNEEFWSLYEFGLLAEYTSYDVANGDTWYYGLTKEELEKDDYVLAIVNPEGAKQIKKIYKDKVYTILITANDKQRIIRYLDRDKKGDVSECCRRFLADEKDFENMEYDFIVENNNLEDAYLKLNLHIRALMGNSLLEEVREEFIKNPERFIGGKDA